MENESNERRIVVGVREPQDGLLDFAENLAHTMDCGLRVVHAWVVPASAAYAAVWAGVDVGDQFARSGREVLVSAEQHLASTPARVQVDVDLVNGWAPAVLAAESHGAKAVVVGTDDIGWLDRTTGEAVTNFLCLHAASPVVVVPPSLPDFTLDEVVACVDGRSASTGPLHFAFELADRAGVRLRVLHVTRHLDGAQEIEEQRLRLAEVLAGWSEDYPDTPVSTVIAEGHDPAEKALDASGEGTLLVAGQPKGGPVRRWRAPVVRELVRPGRSPVAIVPNDYAG